jgi:hypothetical protein
MKILFIVSALLISLAGSASAQLLGVQFSPSGSTAVAGPGVLGETSYAVVSSFGSGIDIGDGITLDFTTSASSSDIISQTATGSPNSLFAGLAYANNGGTSGSTGTITFTLHNLTDGGEYELAGYGGSSDAGTDSAAFSGAIQGVTVGQVTYPSGTHVSRNSFVLGAETATAATYVQGTDPAGNYVEDMAMASPSGTLTFSVTGLSSYSAYTVVNGFAIEALPEPGTWALVGLGALVLLAVRRHKLAR